MRESCNYYGPGCCVKQQLFEWKERLLLHMKNYIYICGGSQFTGWDGVKIMLEAFLDSRCYQHRFLPSVSFGEKKCPEVGFSSV